MEDSFSMVHASEGIGKPLSDSQRSETAIVAGIANAAVGNTPTINWLELAGDYNKIRDHIAATIPGFDDFNRKCELPGASTWATRPPSCASGRRQARRSSAMRRCRPRCSRS
ncbi:hypothetical protein GGER_32920 [Serratia rubidaea]